MFIIALGESIIALGVAATAHPLTPLRLAAVAATYGVAFGLWWAYFHFAVRAIRRALERAKVRTEVMRPVLTYGHIFLIGSVVAVAVGLSDVVAAPMARLGVDAAILLFGGTALYLATFGYTYWRRYRRISYARLGGAAATLLLLPTAPVQPALSSVLMVILVLMVINAAEARWTRRGGLHLETRRGERP